MNRFKVDLLCCYLITNFGGNFLLTFYFELISPLQTTKACQDQIEQAQLKRKLVIDAQPKARGSSISELNDNAINLPLHSV